MAQALLPNVRGALWMVAGAVIFTINASLVKFLGASGIDSLQIVFVRSLAGVLLLLPFVVCKASSIHTQNFRLQILQGIVGSIALISHFYAWTKLPLTDVTALLFTQALFVLVLAVVVLRQRIQWRRWLATIFGFAGVALMTRPSFDHGNVGAPIALLAAFCIALQLIVIARLPRQETQITMLLYLGLVGTFITALPGLHAWKAPTGTQTILLICNGILGLANQACVFRAFRVGAATYVAPFDYSKLIVAAMIGFIWFGEIPTPWTMLGAAIIVISTLYISRQEIKLAAEQTPFQDPSERRFAGQVFPSLRDGAELPPP